MSRTFYSDYVRHAMRFYSRTVGTTPPQFKTEVDKLNWMSCHAVVKTYSDRERDILVTVYGGYDTLPDEVYGASKKFGIHQNIIWDMMKDFERKVAKKRLLV